MQPTVNGLEEEYASWAVVEQLDINHPNTDEARVTYRLRVQPYVVLLNGEGQVVESWQGYRDKAVFEEAGQHPGPSNTVKQVLQRCLKTYALPSADSRARSSPREAPKLDKLGPVWYSSTPPPWGWGVL